VLDRCVAQSIVERCVPVGRSVNFDEVQELRDGWFFALQTPKSSIGASAGLVVNKNTGKTLEVGLGGRLAHDLELYDKGYQFEMYDLVVLEVCDLEHTLDILADLGICVIEPEFEHGVVWRVPRALTRGQLGRRLRRIPCIFERVNLRHRAERLEEARQTGYFRFEALENRQLGPV
jgi:hypothetical protein